MLALTSQRKVPARGESACRDAGGRGNAPSTSSRRYVITKYPRPAAPKCAGIRAKAPLAYRGVYRMHELEIAFVHGEMDARLARAIRRVRIT